MWMCDTCRDVACRPVILTSIVVPVAPAVTRIVPAAVTPGSGFSLNDTPAGGLGELAGAAVSPPQAAPASTIASVATQARADVTAARHRVPALPQQVTGTP